MIISLTQYKGGVGKTTSAICLATLLSREAPTLLIDSDPNRSASLWARKGQLPFDVCSDSEAPKRLMSGQYKNTVIDTPARPAADDIKAIAQGADLLILPTTPDPLSLSALVQIASELPKDSNYRCLVTLSPPAPQTDGADAIAALQRNGLPVFSRAIRRYKAYIKAADAGVEVKKAPGGGTAWRDWEEVWKELNND
ncbi:MAG: ParA family protein [Cyanobacteria bacterium P01_C01_bin.121]